MAMIKVVILGNSLAGVLAAEKVREFLPESSILLLLVDGEFPIYPHLTAAWVAGDVEKKAIIYKTALEYQKAGIEIRKEKISRIHCGRQYLTTEEKEKIRYDYLFITQPLQKKMTVLKGLNKTGVFDYVDGYDLQEAANLLAISQTVAIQAQGIGGLKMAAALAKKGKEVLYVTPLNHILPRIVDDAGALRVQQILAGQGVRFFTANPIIEVLGEREMKAIRLSSGKVLACDMLLLEDVASDLRLFEEAELSCGKEGIIVNEFCQTSFENVFVFDRLIDGSIPQRQQRFDQQTEDLSRQALLVAQTIARREAKDLILLPIIGESAMTENRIDLAEISILFTGQLDGFAQIQVWETQSIATGIG
jgi:NAD(P)H-nitrite reductase large subunit